MLDMILISIDEFKRALDEGRIEQLDCGEYYYYIYIDSIPTEERPFDNWPSKFVQFNSFDDMISAIQYYNSETNNTQKSEYWIYAKYKEIMTNLSQYRDENLTMANLAKLSYNSCIPEIEDKYTDKEQEDICGIADDLALLMFNYIYLEVDIK